MNVSLDGEKFKTTKINALDDTEKINVKVSKYILYNLWERPEKFWSLSFSILFKSYVLIKKKL